MEYKKPDYDKIGERIRQYRLNCSISDEFGNPQKSTQENLLEYMRRKGLPVFGRNTLSKLEGGREEAFSAVTMTQWNALCSVFGCSIGHLLGEYDCHNFDIQFIQNETGLSEKAVDTILTLQRNNQMDWGLDTLNVLLEDSDFVVLLYYMIQFSTAGDGYIEDGREHIKKRDIFEMRLSDYIKKIAGSLTERNANKPDYRHLYKLYLNAYLRPDNQGQWRSLGEIQSDMEQNGLVFDKKMFEGRERDG